VKQNGAALNVYLAFSLRNKKENNNNNNTPKSSMLVHGQNEILWIINLHYLNVTLPAHDL
jgi:hypothetical protein